MSSTKGSSSNGFWISSTTCCRVLTDSRACQERRQMQKGSAALVQSRGFPWQLPFHPFLAYGNPRLLRQMVVLISWICEMILDARAPYKIHQGIVHHRV